MQDNTIVHNNGTFGGQGHCVPTCSCGWEGKPRTSVRDAHRAGNAHVANWRKRDGHRGHWMLEATGR